jgi:hypothetical protein
MQLGKMQRKHMGGAIQHEMHSERGEDDRMSPLTAKKGAAHKAISSKVYKRNSIAHINAVYF